MKFLRHCIVELFIDTTVNHFYTGRNTTDKKKLPISYHYNTATLFIIAREPCAPKCNSCQYLHTLQARLVVLVG